MSQSQKYRVVVIHNDDDDIKGEYEIAVVDTIEQAKDIVSSMVAYLTQTLLQVMAFPAEEPIEIAIYFGNNVVHRESI